ncbi:MAG: sporulation protein YabP [Hyphomonadaceae bacterium]|nr:sporulation protein YabP [Clostridia bacterium]
MPKAVTKTISQNLIIENREKISISGVLDVESFNEDSVIIHTDLGALFVKGEGLKMNRLNVESGEVMIEGLIHAFNYQDGYGGKVKGTGFFSRLFK